MNQLPPFSQSSQSSNYLNINHLLNQSSSQTDKDSATHSEQKQEDVSSVSSFPSAFRPNHQFAVPQERPLTLMELHLEIEAKRKRMDLLKNIHSSIETLGKNFKAFIEIERNPVICQKFLEMQMATQEFIFSLISPQSVSIQPAPTQAISPATVPFPISLSQPVSHSSSSTTRPPVVSAHPSQPQQVGDVITYEAMVLLQQGRLDAAYQQCEVVLTLNPQHALALCTAATILEKKQQLVEAGDLFRKALHYAPDNVVIQGCYAMHLKNRGFFEQAEIQCEDGLKKHSQDKVILCCYLDCLVRQNKLGKACEICEQLLAIDPFNSFAQGVARDLMQKGCRLRLPSSILSPF